MQKNKKLVLFDIDGTLLTNTKNGIDQWKKQIQTVFADIYNPLPDFDPHLINGKIERQYFRELAKLVGVSDEEFEKNFSRAIAQFSRIFIDAIDNNLFELIRIESAFEFVTQLQTFAHIELGLITGNNQPVAWHKLKKVHFDTPFTFGVFGDEAENRGELVNLAIRKAMKHFSVDFLHTDVVVIGDTKHDIAAAKQAGVIAVGVTTGHTDASDNLRFAGADLVVDSLMDPRVSALFEV